MLLIKIMYQYDKLKKIQKKYETITFREEQHFQYEKCGETYQLRRI